MQKALFILSLCFLSLVSLGQDSNRSDTNTVTLPNGWGLSPAGRSLPLGDFPLNMVVSHSKKIMAVTNNGQSIQSIQLMDVAGEKELDRVVVGRSWYGLAFSADDRELYVGGGHDNGILVYGITDNHLQLKDTIELGKK